MRYIISISIISVMVACSAPDAEKSPSGSEAESELAGIPAGGIQGKVR